MSFSTASAFLAIPHKAFQISRIHSLFSESVADPLASHAGNHEGDNVLQSPRQLKHDHYQRHWEKRNKEIKPGTEVLVLNCTYIIISLLFIKILTTLKLERYLKICYKCHFIFAH